VLAWRPATDGPATGGPATGGPATGGIGTRQADRGVRGCCGHASIRHEEPGEPRSSTKNEPWLVSDEAGSSVTRNTRRHHDSIGWNLSWHPKIAALRAKRHSCLPPWFPVVLRALRVRILTCLRSIQPTVVQRHQPALQPTLHWPRHSRAPFAHYADTLAPHTNNPCDGRCPRSRSSAAARAASDTISPASIRAISSRRASGAK
jgi:hypothetical protein